MGSSTGAILFYCVALSVVATAVVVSSAAAAEVPPNEESDFISAAAMASSSAAAKTSSPSRKLVDTPGSKCPVKFEKMAGYVELGKKCRKPPYKECCAGFIKFACPYFKLINHVDNGCADDMFYFMRTKGDMDPSVFLYECPNDPKGVKCGTTR